MPPPLHPHATTPLHLTLRALSLLLPLSIFISNSSSLAGYFELYSLRQPPPIARVINCSHLLFPFPFLFFNPNNKRNQQHHRRTAINGSIAVNRVCSLWNWSSGWLSLRPFNFLPTQWMRSSSLSLSCTPSSAFIQLLKMHPTHTHAHAFKQWLLAIWPAAVSGLCSLPTICALALCLFIPGRCELDFSLYNSFFLTHVPPPFIPLFLCFSKRFILILEAWNLGECSP